MRKDKNSSFIKVKKKKERIEWCCPWWGEESNIKAGGGWWCACNGPAMSIPSSMSHEDDKLRSTIVGGWHGFMQIPWIHLNRIVCSCIKFFFFGVFLILQLKDNVVDPILRTLFIRSIVKTKLYVSAKLSHHYPKHN